MVTRQARRVVGWAGVLFLSMTGCKSAPPTDGSSCPIPDWQVGQAEVLTWVSEDPGFSQDRALEGSGLTASGDMLFATSEKYYRLLQIDTRSMQVVVSELDVPVHSELEGVTLIGNTLLLCDEAHAAVVAVDLEVVQAGEKAPARQLTLRGLEIEGGKLGLEGITALDDGSGRVFLLLERSGDEHEGCKSTIFPMRLQGDELSVEGTPLQIALEDCNWRLTGLQWWKGRLFALKTRYPGERYELVTVNPVGGQITRILDLTELLVDVTRNGWGNNVEGITISPDGALWLLSDNAETGVISSEAPPVAKSSTLLMRIPAEGFACRD